MSTAHEHHFALRKKIADAASADRKAFQYAAPSKEGATRIYISNLDTVLLQIAEKLARLDQLEAAKSDDML